MSTRVALLTLVLFVTCTSQTCPDDYKCAWENEWFVLTCTPRIGHIRYSTVKGIIQNVPIDAVRLEISCNDIDVPVQLNFANLPNVRQLTVDTISDVSRDGMFKGVPNVTHLVLRNLSWKRIVSGTFSGLSSLLSLTFEDLPHLQHMDEDFMLPLDSLQSLQFRYIGSFSKVLRFEDYAHVLGRINNSDFHKLVLRGIHSFCTDETELNIDDFFKYGSVNTVLKYLDLGENCITTFSGSPAVTLPVLQYISLAGNYEFGIYLPSVFWLLLFEHNRVENLDISGSSIVKVGAGLGSVISKKEQIFSLTVGENDEPHIPIVVGPHLTTVAMTHTVFVTSSDYAPLQVKFHDPYGALKNLHLSNARPANTTIYNIGNLRAVEYLNVQSIGRDAIGVDLFIHMPNLTVLLLGENDMSAIFINDTKTGMFDTNVQLKVLDLARCQLTEISPSEFSTLVQLQNLNLSGNSLNVFHVELHTLRALRILNLSYNKLATLSVAIITELNSLEQIEVDLSQNPWDCSCNNTKFVRWIQNTRVNFLKKGDTYCNGGNNKWKNLFSPGVIEVLEHLCPINVTRTTGSMTSKPNITLVQNDTSKTHFTSKPNIEMTVKDEETKTAWKNSLIISLSVTLVVVVVAIPIVIYVLRRYRWKLALHCHRFHRGSATSGVEDEVTYERDAFICFNSSDRAWVCNDLLQHMEANEITTVIHHRDFLPGSILEESIRESIDRCRFTVLVLSPDFLASNWCLLEMHLARSRIISQGRDVIVPVILREFPPSLLTRTLEGILSRSYLEWTDDPEGQVLFWDKLVTKLKHGGNIRPLKM